MPFHPLDVARPHRPLFSYFALSAVVLLVPFSVTGQEVASPAEAAAARETLLVRFKTDDVERESIGEVVQKYRDGSLLFLTPDGQLWTLLEDQILSREPSEAVMQPLTSEEIYSQFREQLAPGFQVYKTKHFVIVYNTTGAYANWVGELFERLYRGFYNYWERHHRMQLEEPRFPLVAVVFRDKDSYVQFAEKEVGDSARAMIGYYNMKSNRMVMYDLTGSNGQAGGPATNIRMINQRLSQPQWERTVATIVHEAVHQIAYNSGLQVRLADNPRWLSEGLAMYFESPDFGSRTGWSMGKINYHNLRKFIQFLPRRPADSITTLISSDARLMQSRLAADAYPESWALTYFLMKTKKQEYSAYLRELAEMPPLGETTEKERVALFQSHFGEDLQQLDLDFLRYMSKLR